MTEPVQPYFFDEAERAANAKQPGDREKALTFTLDDLKWLKHVYLATHAARIAQKDPMHVCQLLLKVTGSPDIPLAGAFAMSRPDDAEVTLYTPWKGLIKFADMDDLKSKLKEWLTTLQDTTLSIKTPLTQLFMTEDPDTGVWEDLGSTSYENTDRVKKHILTLTGEENLIGARKIFNRDPLVRLKVQLGNADSVAWLISHMGRQLHASTP
jgi:hypothetical protein